MSLRIKLPLFTALFTVLTSCAILTITIQQHFLKRNKDIAMLTMLGEKSTDIDYLVTTRTNQIREDTKAIIRERIVYSLVLLFICVMVIFIFTERITKPINRLVDLAEAITGGRKSYSERIALRSSDEIGRLTSSFNTLLEHIEQSIATVERTAAKYRELIENANSAIVRIDVNGVVIFFNEYAQKLFGYSPEKVIGRPIHESIGKPLGHFDHDPNILNLLKKETYIELEHRAENGRYLWIGWTIRPIGDTHGDMNEFLCVGSDITEKKKAEKYAAMQQRKLLQTDKMATLGVIAAGIAHEINNPNNFIILNSQNFAELWEDIKPVLDKHARDDPDYSLAGIPYGEMEQTVPVLMSGITDGARRIKHIVDTLKDFARKDSGDLNETVDICKVIEAARLITGNLIKKATDRFVVDIRNEIPAVHGNFQRLEQVIINLISNACQATDAPGKPIVITGEYQPPSRRVLVSVSDEGAGIPPENIKDIFSPFFTTKRESGGTGLGLAIAYSIVKDHGGELKIESTVGKGTIATMLLPVE